MTNITYGIAPPGFRLPDATRVGTVHLQINRLQQSIDYYEQVVGLQPLSRSHGMAALGVQGRDAPLMVLHERQGIRPASLRGSFGLYHFAIVWSYPGVLFLSAGGYHHHLATNTWSRGPAATDDQARLLEWELAVPSDRDTSAAAQSMTAAGFEIRESDAGWTAADPWGTELRVVADQARDAKRVT